MWTNILTAIALVLVIEGVLPFMSPKLWRYSLARLASNPDRVVRITGLVSMLIGVVIMVLLHSGII